MLQDYFSGVPEFPLARCREILVHNQQQQQPDDVLAAVDAIRAIWQAFVDKWGYYGAPIILKDLPPVLRAPTDSFVRVSVVAKGEPLSYQWFNDDALIEGATQSFLYISQSIQPHNAGSYYCEISNWKDKLTTAVMEVDVVNDQFEVDPTLKYRIPRELLRDDDIVIKVRASTGAFLYHRETGARLLLPPHCFRCLDVHGNDVSDSLGLEVLIRTLAPVDKQWGLKLRRGETLVSCIIEVLPYSAPTFLRPLTLLIAHLMSSLDQHNQLLVVKVDPVTGGYQDLPSFSSHLESNKQQQQRMTGGSPTSVEISAFGAFAVIFRSLPSNLEVEHPLEQVKLYFVRPKCVTTAAYHRKVVASLWVSRDRPDAIQSAKAQIQDHLENIRDSSTDANQQLQWTIDTFVVGIRCGNLLCVQFGEKERIVYQWDAQEEKKKDNQSSIGALESSASHQHQYCIAKQIELQPSEIMDTSSTPEEPLPPLCTMKIDVAVRKPSSYSLKSKSKVDTSFSVLLSEMLWQVLIPVANNTPRVPPKPQLMQRTPTQVVLEFDFSKAPGVKSNSIRSADSRKSTFKGASSRLSLFDAGKRELHSTATEDPDDAKSENRFEEIHEGEREFTPYFYVVEMAKFSDTFWQRYDQTWWFDKAKTKIIDGMYKVVHLGFEPFAKITTDAYAGCFRVAQCSLDSFGAYSEPFLLEPLVVEREQRESSQAKVDSDGSAKSASGLVWKLRSLQSSSSPRSTITVCDDCSAAVTESKARLQQLLAAIYTTFEHFEALFGFPNDGVESVMKSLEALKTKHRASNRELALLLLALRRLKVLMRNVHLRKHWIAKWIQKLLLLERLVPELDCYPVEFFSKVTAKLHQMAIDMFMIVMKLSSNGWLRHLLLNEWFESDLRSIVERAIELLTNDGATLRGAKEIAQELQAFLNCQDKEGDSQSGGDLEQMATDKMRIFALQLLGKYLNESKEAKLLIAEQLVHALELVPKPIKRAGDNEETEIIDVRDQVVAEFAQELALSSTHDALEKLRQEDSLERHICHVSPANGESCQRIPARIAIHLDPLVANVNTQQQVLKVTNITSSSASVHGKVAFSSSDGLLTFAPTVAFERKSKYAVKVRCEEIQTCLGASLRGFITFHFRTS